MQPRVNSLVVAQKLDQAIQTLGQNPKAYGRNNQLLYWLDRGMVLHSAGEYAESIRAFAQAQRMYEELYTKSISKMISAWALNDYSAPYRGEDYEYVLSNVFQAINYLMLGDPAEALVEARDMNSKLSLLNRLYEGKNVYKDDAFGRFFMGLLYEVNGTPQDLNDAFISYARAHEVYIHDFQTNYGIALPRVLKENLLTMARFMGGEEWERYRQQFPDTPLITLEERNRKAQVYLIQYTGFSPVKISYALPIPIDPTHVTQIVFPKFIPRYSQISASEFLAESGGQLAYVQPSEVAQNIDALAPKLLEHRRVQIFSKSLLRPAAKYFAAKAIEDQIEDNYGQTTGQAFGVLSSLYNLSTERADLRSWQTLPGQIRIARLMLDPGEYEFFVRTYSEDQQVLNKVSLGKLQLTAGEKKFYVFRNYR